jgi:hypothetical protein
MGSNRETGGLGIKKIPKKPIIIGAVFILESDETIGRVRSVRCAKEKR